MIPFKDVISVATTFAIVVSRYYCSTFISWGRGVLFVSRCCCSSCCCSFVVIGVVAVVMVVVVALFCLYVCISTFLT